VVIYCVILSASRGTLLVILTGALYLYTQNGRLRFVHLLAIGALIVAAMSGLSFLRMSSESMANSFLGDDLLLTFLSPIYTYVAFNFENFNSLVRADLQPTYVFYALKFVLWPIYKFDYESGAIRLTDFDTLFFNARTFLYPFYHDLGLIGCVLYPGLISLLVSVFRNSVTRNPARIILLMGLQKPIWFAFFGNYFFGELSVFTPLLVLGLLAAAYPRARRPHRSLPTSLPQPLRPGEYTEDSSPDQTMSSSSTSLSILFIAPLPPPLTGHSIADQVLLEGLEGRHRVDVVDLSLGSRHDGSLSLERIRAVLDVLRKVRNRRQGVDVAYLTISESIAGNLKDLLIFRLLRRKVGRIVVHLHGGSFRVAVLERSRLLRRWNASFLSSVDRIVVTGRSHEAIFQGIAAPERLAVVPNFALPALFTTVDAIRRKFADVERVRVLYVSGMDRRKGYARLLDAYLELPPEARSRLRLDFAGRFDDAQEQAAFEAKIAGLADVIYHGVVDGDRKRNLFASAHVFCLPTAYLEGQPLTILEAYASGCVVLTTPQPGILDGFVPGVNGHLISTDDAAPLRACLVALGANPGQALVIALANFDDAQKNYRSDTFCERMIRILEGR
jgi:glycosyltransferase involved in cell wall biosynthesis